MTRDVLCVFTQSPPSDFLDIRFVTYEHELTPGFAVYSKGKIIRYQSGEPPAELLRQYQSKRELDPRFFEPIFKPTTRRPAYWDELDAIFGLEDVKEEIRRIEAFARVTCLRSAKGMPPLNNAKHMVFLGSPGTGKTTVARIIGKIFREHGLLSKGDCIETDRATLVGEFIGKSEKTTLAKLEEAYGSVLLIDEFYGLLGTGNDFGQNVITTLVKYMEDKRDNLCVIATGYPGPMKKALLSNPGLMSRFSRTLTFPDPGPEDLLRVFAGLLKAKGYQLDKRAFAPTWQVILNHYRGKTETFGNARDMRNFFERLTEVQATRFIQDESQDISLVLQEDIEQAAHLAKLNGA